MKIILLEDIVNLGVSGDVVDVKRGYAHNYLLKNGRAMRATPENLEKLEEIREEQAKKNAENRAAAEKLAEMINELVLEIPVKAGDEGRLYGSITNRDIVDFLNDKHEIELDRRKILLEEPIRELGEKEVRVRPYPEIEAVLKINVIPE